MPGFDRSSKEIARRFAADEGLIAVMPHLHSREGKGASPDASAASRAAGGVPDDRLVGDVDTAMEESSRCFQREGGDYQLSSGGRQSFLAAVSLKLSAG